jgi:hypothetical protein
VQEEERERAQRSAKKKKTEKKRGALNAKAPPKKPVEAPKAYVQM